MATSRLQKEVSRLLSIYFGKYTIRENIRPDWLICNCERLELDFYVEELEVAIEVQGQQHYRFVPLFHGDFDGFKKRLVYDEQKRIICAKRGIRLFEVSSLDEIYPLIEDLIVGRSDENDLYFTQMLKKEIALKTAIEDVRRKAPKTRKKSKRQTKRESNRKDYYQFLGDRIERLEKHLREQPDNEYERISRRLASCKSLMIELEDLICD